MLVRRTLDGGHPTLALQCLGQHRCKPARSVCLTSPHRLGAYPKAAPGLAGFDSSYCSSLLERLVCPALSFVETADLRDEVCQGSGVRTNT